MLAYGSPEPRERITLESAIADISKLQHRTVSVGLDAQPKGHIDPASSEVETTDVIAPLFIAQKRIEHVVKVEIQIVILKRPTWPALTLHVVQHRVKAVSSDYPPLKIEARNGGRRSRAIFQNLEANGLTAGSVPVLVRVELRHDFLSESEVIPDKCVFP